MTAQQDNYKNLDNETFYRTFDIIKNSMTDRSI